MTTTRRKSVDEHTGAVCRSKNESFETSQINLANGR